MWQHVLLDFLANQTDFFHPDEISEVFTTRYLARRFSMQRNTVSHYLNQLVSRGTLIKITTRPVCFLHKSSFEKQFFSVSRNEFSSISELLNENHQETEQADYFSLLIGHDASLAIAISQLKTALFYPDGGLPLLISGDSGTGKSYMAKLLHHYAVSQGILSAEAPFINFNCAQYASNPELLAANLFGYVKGAFTGANSDKSGAFAAAHGGMLFLDEVHRLQADGQEKLFTYLDKGEIYRLGDSKQAHKLSVRLIFATTEEIHSTFLNTFIRRIPIQVTLPALEERSREEKQALIMLFFWQEAQKISVRLTLSSRLLSVLGSYTYHANVGELKNVIKYTVASAFAKNAHSPLLTLSIHDLPQSLMAQLTTTDDFISECPPVTLDETSNLASLLYSKNSGQKQINHARHNILALFANYKTGQTDWEETEKRLDMEIENLFDKLVFDKSAQEKSHLLLFTTSQVREAFYLLEKRFNIRFNGNCVYALAHYLLCASSQNKLWFNKEQIRQLDEFLLQRQPILYRFAHQLLDLISQKLDLTPATIDYLILILWLHKTHVLDHNKTTRAVILAHGYATASSIASVANRLLKSNLFESFDMPLDVTPEDIARQLTSYLNSLLQASALLILVDMGSLNLIHQYFKHNIILPIAIINNVSTRMALYTGERILQGDSLEAISRDIATDLAVEHQLLYPQRNKPRAIITTCVTGIGAAGNLCRLLKSSIPHDLDIEFIAYDYATLQKNKRQEIIFTHYDVIAIIGTADPMVPSVSWFSLDWLIAGRGSELLMALFSHQLSCERINDINNTILKNFSLHRVIESVTILDTNRIINQVEHFLLRYEHLSSQQVANDRKVALYVHISCLIERLIRHAAIQSYPASSNQCPQEQINWLRQAFSVIENNYSVGIPVSELYYIYDLLSLKTEFIQQDQEF